MWNKLNAMAWFRRTIYLVMLVAILIQVVVIANEYLVPWGYKIWDLRNLDSWERSAQLASWLHPDDVAYLNFLRRSIPANAIVVVPPRGTYLPYGWINNMTYNLFPRRLQQCAPKEIESCIQGIEGEKIFIIRVYDFPPPELVPNLGEYLSHSDELGLIEYQAISIE